MLFNEHYEYRQEKRSYYKLRDEYSNFNKTYDYLVNKFIATEQEIDLVCTINGHTLESLNDILEVRTGYKNLEQAEREEY